MGGRPARIRPSADQRRTPRLGQVLSSSRDGDSALPSKAEAQFRRTLERKDDRPNAAIPRAILVRLPPRPVNRAARQGEMPVSRQVTV